MNRFVSTAIALLLAAGAAFAASKPQPPVFPIGFTTKSPSMDIGQDRHLWDPVPSVVLGKTSSNHVTHVPNTKVSALYDNKNLYFWFQNNDHDVRTNPGPPCPGVVTPVSGLIWPKADINTIYLLSGGPDFLSGQRLADRFVISAGQKLEVDRLTYAPGSHFPGKRAERRSNKDFTLVVGRVAGGWIAELRIPFSELSALNFTAPAPGQGVGVQVLRLDRPDGVINCNPDAYNNKSNSAMAWPCGKLTNEWDASKFAQVSFATARSAGHAAKRPVPKPRR